MSTEPLRFENLKLLRYFLANAAEFGEVIDGVAAIRKAEGLQAKWELTKATGDQLVPMLVDFQGIIGTLDEPVESVLVLSVEASGFGDKIREYWPKVLKLIALLNELFGEDQG